MKVVAVIQARMGSSRLPGKVMMDLCGEPVLSWVVRGCLMAPGVDEVVVATTTEERDDEIEKWCGTRPVGIFRGSETDVLSRFVGAAEKYSADVILRITGDCPFVDPEVIGSVVRLHKKTGAPYVSNIHPRTYPDGLDVELFTRDLLMTAHAEATRAVDRDCVTYWIVRNRSRFPAEAVVCPVSGLQDERWVLDTEADLKFCRAIAERMVFDPVGKKYEHSTYLNILEILDKHPGLRELNAGHVMNERFYDALADEAIVPRNYGRSAAQLARAEAVIPLGAQTFSKSRVQFPAGSPLFLSHGQGALVWDIDGNEYVDCVSALLPVVLGYRDPDVDAAIRRQLGSGISFSLATELEAELAERLRRLIPCAEMARFGKNGSDVTTAAIRVARAHTGHDRVLMCKSHYHGWGDWALSEDRSVGVPEAVRDLTTRIPFGHDPEMWLKAGDVAAIIVEPETNPEYLKLLRERCDHYGAVLIFDEIITGFRFDMGGAQKLYGVTPDLATFGKAMGNGMPINAIVGKRKLMQRMAPGEKPNVFFSGTFQGETLSLAAAIATIDKMERDKVIRKLWNTGAELDGAVQALINAHGLETTVKLSGHAPLVRLNFSSPEVATLFRKEMIATGTLIIGSHNISASHDANCLRRILKSYEHTFGSIADCLKRGDLKQRIGNDVVQQMVRAS